jgi:hypothetical protein
MSVGRVRRDTQPEIVESKSLTLHVEQRRAQNESDAERRQQPTQSIGNGHGKRRDEDEQQHVDGDKAPRAHADTSTAGSLQMKFNFVVTIATRRAQ